MFYIADNHITLRSNISPSENVENLFKQSTCYSSSIRSNDLHAQKQYYYTCTVNTLFARFHYPTGNPKIIGIPPQNLVDIFIPPKRLSFKINICRHIFMTGHRCTQYYTHSVSKFWSCLSPLPPSTFPVLENMYIQLPTCFKSMTLKWHREPVASVLLNVSINHSVHMVRSLTRLETVLEEICKEYSWHGNAKFQTSWDTWPV